MTNGSDDIDLQGEVIYYQMAKLFKFDKETVDQLDYDSVLGMLSMEAHSRKKQYDQSKMKNGGKF